MSAGHTEKEAVARSDGEPSTRSDFVWDLESGTARAGMGDEQGIRQWLKRVNSADRSRAYCLVHDIEKGKKDQFEEHFRIDGDEGRVRHLRIEGTVTRNEEGEPVQLRAGVTDVTAEMELLEKLKRENLRLRQVLERLPDGILLVDSNGIHSYANRPGAYMHFDHVSGLEGRSLAEVLPADLERAIRRHIDIAFETGETQLYRYEASLPGRHTILEARVLPSSLGEAVIVTRDMTDHERIEKDLERRDAILSAVAFAAERFLKGEATDETISEFLRQLGEATGVSRVFIFRNIEMPDSRLGTELAFEWTPDEESSLRESELLADGAPVHWMSLLWHDALRAGEIISGTATDFPEREQEILSRFGAKSVTIAPIFLGKNWWGFMGFTVNDKPRTWTKAEVRSLRTAAMVLGAALERHGSERRILQSEERWRNLVDAHPGPIVVCAEGNTVYVNQAAVDVLGADSKSEILGRAVHELMPEEMLLDCGVKGVDPSTDRSKRHRGEYRLSGLDGVERIVELISVPTSYEGKAAVQIVLENVTERKKFERGLIEAKDRAEEMNRLKTSFLANMSHEIRTPLTSIVGYADLLTGETEGKAQEFAQLIRAGASRLMDTLISVLDYAQLEGGGIRLREDAVDLRNELNQIRLLYQSRYKEKGVTLEIHRLDPVLSYVVVDKRALGRVIINLVDNALKFTAAPGKVSISAEGDKEAHKIVIRVTDTGIGIDPKFLPHIFDAFKQESEGLSRKYGGNGLGLAITHRLVEMLGGNIEVSSTMGAGTTFTVTLPLNTG